MLRRIILIVAILAALAVGVVNFAVVKDKINTLTNDRNDQRTQKETAQHQLSETKKTLAATQLTLTQTQGQLADSQAAQHKDEMALAAANTQISDLNGKLTKASKDRDEAEGELEAYKVTGKTPQQVADMDKLLKQEQNAMDVANEENTVLSHRVASLDAQLKEILQPGYEIPLPADLKGKIMAVDPKWKFVVLNVGQEQGVIKHGEMLVSRDGKLVAKVIVSSVEKDRCIANLVPGWQLGEIIEGDQVIPAHPAS
jgi:hypothetical protein